MGLTLPQRFGTDALIDESTANDPKLVISLNNLKNAVDGGDITNSQGLNTDIDAANADANADRIFAALFVLSKQSQPSSNNTDTLGVFIDDPSKNFTTRNVQEQIEINYPVYFYIPSAGGVLDPDSVVS